MREIKFRAKRADGAGLQYFGIYDVINVFGDDGIFYVRNEFGDTVACVIGTEQQYTGLKDKNGWEIYEGDVVKIKDVKVNNEPRFYIGKIIWCPGAWYAMETKDYIGETIYLNINILETEVIGNIYENPELINEK